MLTSLLFAAGYCHPAPPVRRGRTIGATYENAEQFQQNLANHKATHKQHIEKYIPTEPASIDPAAVRWPAGKHADLKGPRTRGRDNWIPEEKTRQKLGKKRETQVGGDFLTPPYDSVGKQVLSTKATPGR